MPLSGAFRVLLLLLSGASAVALRRGLNVTCHNQQVTVSWERSERGASYRVHVAGSAGEQVDITTENQYDLTPFVWASEDRYLGFHYVTVTTLEGGNQSEPMRTKTFTFNSLKPAHVKCKLDFTPVDLKESDSGATLSFQNPFYRELNKAARSASPSFEFTATFNGRDFRRSCDATEDVCRLALPPGSSSGDTCVSKLKGALVSENGVSWVLFREVGPVCAPDSTELDVLALSLMLLLFFVVTSVVTVLICRAKAWTMKGDPAKTPISLVLSPHEGDMRYALVHREDVSPITVTENHICENPSVGSEEDLQLGACTNYLPLGGGLTWDNSEETESASMDLAHYNRRETQEVDMGDGDVATGYGNRDNDL
ncbi:uncharacterized protein ACO6RY_20070 [Pungitius sinensis]